ncbi:MAG: hypothetical protein R2786_01045 [Flavobacteriaceae bacterium]
MVLDSVLIKNKKPFNFIEKTASFLFSSEYRTKSFVNKAINGANNVLNSLVEVLELINEDVDSINEEIADNLIKQFDFALQLSTPLINSLEELSNEYFSLNDPLAYEIKLLLNKTIEIDETINKVITKLEYIKALRISESVQNLTFNSLNTLWNESEDNDLVDLYKESLD